MNWTQLYIGRGISRNNINLFNLFIQYCSFSVALVDLNDQPLANTNRIPLSIAIYTYENPPKCLDTNTAGIINFN